MKTRAFSLIELTVVLMIMAIAAAAVTLQVRGPLSNAGLRDVVGAVKLFDFTTRVAAREQDRPLRMVVDLSGGRLDRTDDEGGALGSRPLEMPGRYRIAAVRVRKQVVTEGNVAIRCSRRGAMPTYALRLEGVGRGQWIVMAGLTGETVEVDGEEEARDIVAASGTRGDAR